MEKKEREEKIVRIAHIMGKWVGGGVEAVVMNYYRHLNHEKYQFDFICDEDSTDIPYDEIRSFGGKVILVPPYQKILKYQKEITRILREGRYQVVHSHINTLSVIPLYAAKNAGVQVRIAHSHSTTNKKEWKKNLIKLILKPFSRVYATDYFACTEHAGRWLFGNKVFDKGNVFVLNNAIDLNKFKYDETVRKKRRKELEIKDTTFVIGHVGRFVEQKNHMHIIDVFYDILKRKEDALLILVGQGPLQCEIEQKVSMLKIEEKVKFLGQRTDINELYQAMDFFIFPSLYEGLGMALIEAQTSGLPCVCSTEVPQIAKVTNNLEFINLSKDSKEWADMIINMQENFCRINKLEEVKLHGYDIENEVKKLEERYSLYLSRRTI